MKSFTSASFLCLITILSLSGCTSALKKQCEQTNWFNYGEQVAMSGRRLTGDSFIASCEKEEAHVDHGALDVGFKKGMSKYCEPETVFQTGKNGDFFSPDMCDNGNQNMLKQKHAFGVKEYCQKTNGYNAGSKGKAYNQICPKNQEKDFLPEFNKGRKAYLTGFVSTKEEQLRDLERDISTLQAKRNITEHEARLLSDRKVPVAKTIVDPKTGAVSHQTDWVQDEDSKRKASSLEWDVSRMDTEIKNKQQQLELSREELRKAKMELSVL